MTHEHVIAIQWRRGGKNKLHDFVVNDQFVGCFMCVIDCPADCQPYAILLIANESQRISFPTINLSIELKHRLLRQNKTSCSGLLLFVCSLGLANAKTDSITNQSLRKENRILDESLLEIDVKHYETCIRSLSFNVWKKCIKSTSIG